MSNCNKRCHLKLLESKALKAEDSSEIIGHELLQRINNMLNFPAVYEKIKHELFAFFRLLGWGELDKILLRGFFS